VAHKEARKLRQLAQDDRQPSELVVEDLEQPGSDHDPLNANFLSHGENLELCQLADFCWQRRELIPADLKGRVVVRSRSSCHECRTSILLRLVSRPSSGGRDVSWLLKTWKPRACVRSRQIASTIAHRDIRASSCTQFHSEASKACSWRERVASNSFPCETTRAAPPSNPCLSAREIV
jgi:hypothetical protein